MAIEEDYRQQIRDGLVTSGFAHAINAVRNIFEKIQMAPVTYDQDTDEIVTPQGDRYRLSMLYDAAGPALEQNIEVLERKEAREDARLIRQQAKRDARAARVTKAKAAR